MADINGTTGNDNLTGTADDDVINGIAGNDSLDGLDGDDSLNGGDGTDIISGGAGEDDLLGGKGIDTLRGGGENDTLTGGSGADTLTGGFGSNDFVYNNVKEGGDKLTDFFADQPGFDDTIKVSAAGFGGGLTSGADITEGQFVLGTTAADGTDRFIYDRPTGQLFFDKDGTGSLNQQLLLTLNPGSNDAGFGSNDINVIA